MNSRWRQCSAVLAGLVLAASGSDARADSHGSKPLKAAKLRFEASASINTRIIGGADTTIERNPWQVALVYAPDKDDPARAQFCGGSIIHPHWVLTAAHCVDQRTSPDQVDVISGTAKLVAGEGVRVSAEKIEVHDQWRDSTNDFDIALIRVKSPLTGEPIAPAKDPAWLVGGAKIWVSGWGVTNKARSKATDKLQGVSLDYIQVGDCNGPRSYKGEITDNMFCLGIAGSGGGGGKDSCQGDSGGPASIGPETSAKLVGVVSWGVDCALPYKYGVYTKLPNFLDWVKEKTTGEVDW